MYLIIAVIFLMLCVELYTIVKDISLNFNYQEKKLEDSSKNFIEYTSDRSFEKIFDPGEIYTDDNYNLFIITDGLPLLMKKDQIYVINEPFTLKYININEKIIRYYYK